MIREFAGDVVLAAGRAAVGQLHPRHRLDPTPRRWHLRRRHERATVWWTAVAAVVLTGYGMLTDPAATAANWRAIGTLVLAWLIYVWVYVNRKAQVTRQVKRPLAAALTTYFHDPVYVTMPDRMMRLAIDPANEASTIYLPLDWNADTERKEISLAKLAGQRLGLGRAPSYELKLQGDRPYLKVWPAPQPPPSVAYSEPKIKALYEASTAHEPFLGLGPRRVPFYLNRLSAAPHAGTSATTNSGKSSARRPTVAKALHDGWVVLVLDVKQDSMTWAEGLPGCHYAVTAEECVAALGWLSREVDRRFALYRQHKDLDGNVPDGLVGPPILVIAEEVNSMEGDIRSWWKTVRESGDPLQCPAMYALQRSLNMGRGVGIYVEIIGQSLTCQAIGGPAALENIPLRMLIWPTYATWNRLAPQCKVAGKYPRSEKRQGRVHVVSGDDATPVQTMWMTPREAYDYASSGAMAVFPEVSEVGSAVFRPGETPRTEVPHLALVRGGEELDAEAEDVGDEELLTFSEFAKEIGVKVKTLDNARYRKRIADPVEAAPGRPSRYRRSDLEAWAATQPATVGGDAS